jgi:hypothetical protein
MTRYTLEQLKAFNDALLDAVEGSRDGDKFRSSGIDREAAQVVVTFKGDPDSWREVVGTEVPEDAFRVELLPDHLDFFGEG